MNEHSFKGDKIDFDVHKGVYSPAMDSYLVLDAIELKPTDTFLEIGCGVGLATAMASKIVKKAIAVDISLEAVRNTMDTLRRNTRLVNNSVIQSDLLTAFHSSAKFSVIVFNPPYLPADEHKTSMDHAFIGGITGTEVSERYIAQACKHIEKNSTIYVIVSSHSNPDHIIRIMEERGLEVQSIGHRIFFMERVDLIQGKLTA
ncbi:MAG: methyltransferase [Candidatus Lokiarchaeota archaeon]|nr:methyltransferase [Candidatus Lokiarchaeota archaeon]